MREMRDAGRPARARVLHLRVQLVLGLPPVPRGHPRARRPRSGPDAPEVLKLRAFYNHPGFVEANADRVRDALAQIPEERRAAAPLVFTAHSIPTAMAERCRYAEQLAESGRLVADGGGRQPTRARLPEPQRPAPGAVARARRLRPPPRARRHGASRDVVISPDRLRLRPHGGALRPRHRGASSSARSSGSNVVRAGPPERIRRSCR